MRKPSRAKSASVSQFDNAFLVIIEMKKVLVGGNWKANGTMESMKALVKQFNEGKVDATNVEVVIAAPSLHVAYAKDNLRKDFAVSVQNIWSAEKNGETE